MFNKENVIERAGLLGSAVREKGFDRMFILPTADKHRVTDVGVERCQVE